MSHAKYEVHEWVEWRDHADEPKLQGKIRNRTRNSKGEWQYDATYTDNQGVSRMVANMNECHIHGVVYHRRVVTVTKPMLATKAPDLDKLDYPLFVSPKLDGIRCLLSDVGPVSRTLKPIPNDYIRRVLIDCGAVGLDGELITVDQRTRVEPFNTIQGNVMRKDGGPSFLFLVFDTWEDGDRPFEERYRSVNKVVTDLDHPNIQMVPHHLMYNRAQVEAYEETMVEAGYEGVMTRHPKGEYKQGRSTAKQQWLLKIKRFEDAEGKIVSVVQELDKDGVPKNSLGAVELQTQWGGLSVGSGFTKVQRCAYWHEREMLLGRTVTFKYQPFGMGKLPRFPIFKGFREPGS